jgi:hypothetical protein
MKEFSQLQGASSKAEAATGKVAGYGSVLKNEPSAYPDCVMQGFESLNKKVFWKLQVLLNNYIKQYP